MTFNNSGRSSGVQALAAGLLAERVYPLDPQFADAFPSPTQLQFQVLVL
jgi:hypothetical protein